MYAIPSWALIRWGVSARSKTWSRRHCSWRARTAIISPDRRCAPPAAMSWSEPLKTHLPGDSAMIVEERCYTVKPGTVQLYYRDYDPRGLKIQTRILGNLIGYFHTDLGKLNQIVHLWGYESLAERERRRALLAADSEWQEYLMQSPDI